MKIAITTAGTDPAAPMDPRFGRAPHFMVFDTATHDFVLIANPNAAAAQGAGIKAAEAIVKAGAAVLISGECGPKAFRALKQAGVRVYSAKSVSVAGALEAFGAGKLPEATAA
ncbi:NifB/NifX family molybdenum-iron cluster-binding protein [Rhodomicrobium sp. Az07]|uniref:NifB/NifX family molybdenum-iron cluster-binding protein n=1 Tax=Rhodomicrobium sp. Az07 TaxID=2839034 RepID=UPI001BE54BB9|nr:NifB/NifX family molybdenum-iron cluster-binding protein [Rhodomicrobium sp. Az07]MBT3070728.1 NifB/NifX family molybdenum-iron cluster-binding protein [Rhodomicrobium sp. Az07]